MRELPSGWVETRLDALAMVSAGQSPPGVSYNSAGSGTPFLQGKAEFGEVYPTVRKWTTDPRRLAKPDDVLLSVRAPVGSVNLAPFECCIGRGLAALSPLGAIGARYLFWAIRRSARRLQDVATGTTFAAVTGAQVRAHLLPLAPLAEQHLIVAAIEEQFSRLDAADASLGTARSRAQILRDRTVGPALEGDWAWTTLGEIADVAGGVTKDAKRESDPSFVEVPYLRVANVQRGYLDLREVATVRVAPRKTDALRLLPGDVLFNEGGDRDKLGRGWVWSGEIEKCIHQNHVFRARLCEAFDPRFVSWHGNTFGRGWFEAKGRQTTNLASLNMTNLKAFPVPAPPLADQRRIVARIERQLSLVDAGATRPLRRAGVGLARADRRRARRGGTRATAAADQSSCYSRTRVSRARLALERLDERDPFELDAGNIPHLAKHAPFTHEHLREALLFGEPLFYPAAEAGEADWLMVAELAGEGVVMVPLAPAVSGDVRRCRPIGIYRAGPALAGRYRRDARP